MMTKDFIKQAKCGNPVYITSVRKAFEALPKEERQTLNCVLQLLDGSENRLFVITIPVLDQVDEEEELFIKSYVWAEIYNILSSLGGRSMTVYVDTGDSMLKRLADGLNCVFGIGRSRKERRGYGRCINVIDRMLDALCRYDDTNQVGFRFIVKGISEIPQLSQQVREPETDGIFRRVIQGLEGKIICGMDIGGTDIKVTAAVDGRIACFKEYDWFPAGFTMSRQLIDPICMLVRLVRVKLSLEKSNISDESIESGLLHEINNAMDKSADYNLIERAVKMAEDVLGENLIGFDAIGLCFPDVVVRDKIVGGEVYKTRGIRNNPGVDYEEEFAKLTHLNEHLLLFCKPGGVVKNTNDGPMASFTAAVEIAASDRADDVKYGFFAHTLGTELGTGWVDGQGGIPEIPLEVYNFVIDLGSFIEREYEPDDIRSINNFNTGLAGTLQKYTSQSGVFRLAMKYFPGERPDLYQELFDKGFIVKKEVNGGKGLYVPTEPRDMRKLLLEHLMSLPERENDEVCRRIFRDIGEFLAVTWFETERILKPETKSRILFGRLVKNNCCFELMKEGAKLLKDDIRLEVADGTMANTPLMKQLDEDPYYTVAQFAQAVGAIYFANAGLIKQHEV